MSKPNINIPAEFAVNGVKTPFSNAKVQNGFDRINPDVFAGDNLNQFIDDTYKGLNGVLELYEGCVLYDSTVTYTNKSLVFDITNDKIKFYHSLQNGNINHALTDTDYWEEVNLGSSSRNVGEIISSTLPLTDAGLHLLDGTLLPYGIYKEFIDYIADLYAENPSANYFTTEALWQSSVSTYGVCGKFVYDSTNNTVRLPKVTGKIDGTTDLNALGDLEPLFVRLPNITGSFYSTCDNTYTSSSGAFSTVSTGSYTRGMGNYTVNWAQRTFNASRSSSVYSGDGSNTAIHEQAIKCFIYIVIAISSKTEIQTNIDEITTDLNGKMDVDLSNMSASQSAKNEIISWGMPDWSNAIEITSSFPYTCPSSGYLYLRNFNGFAEIVSNVNTTTYGYRVVGTSVGSNTVMFPVQFNEVLTLSAISGQSNMYFTPMKGAN